MCISILKRVLPHVFLMLLGVNCNGLCLETLGWMTLVHSEIFKSGLCYDFWCTVLLNQHSEKCMFHKGNSFVISWHWLKSKIGELEWERRVKKIYFCSSGDVQLRDKGGHIWDSIQAQGYRRSLLIRSIQVRDMLCVFCASHQNRFRCMHNAWGKYQHWCRIIHKIWSWCYE